MCQVSKQRWLGMGRGGWLLIQWLAGTQNAFAILISLDRGFWFDAAVSALMVAVIADWPLPDDPPGRRSWIRDLSAFVLRKWKGQPVDENGEAAKRVVEKLGRLMQTIAAILLGPERPGEQHDWSTLPAAVQTAKEAEVRNAAVRAAAGPLSAWWAMVQAQEAMSEKTIPDHEAILHFMGSGASAAVTAGQLRELMAAIYPTQPVSE